MRKTIIKQIILVIIICKIFFLISPCLVFALTFDERRQAWLDRDGASVDMHYDTRTQHGKTYIFAWMEKGIDEDPLGLGAGTLSQNIQDCLDYNNQAGWTAGLTVMRALLQYENQLNSQTLYNIHEMYDTKVQNTWGVASRAVQIQRTVESYLYTSYFFPDAEFQYGYIDGVPDPDYKDWRADCNGCSGTLYEVGKFYLTNQYTKDLFYSRMQVLVFKGNEELDSAYTDLLIKSLLLIYDFTKEPEMKRRVKMMLDFMMLELAMEYSAGHKGGALASTLGFRVYRFNVLENRFIDEEFYALLGLGAPRHGSVLGHYYSSTYRAPELIQELVDAGKNTKRYWHIHKENNGIANAERDWTTGKFTYVTPYYTLGGAESAVPSWQLTLQGDDDVFRIWINREDHSGDPDVGYDVPFYMGDKGFYQYKNAVLQEGGYQHLHVVKGDDVFNYGEWNLEPNPTGTDYKNDYDLGSSSWKFFQKKNVMLAMKQGDCSWAIEVVNEGNQYPNLDAFKAAVNNTSDLTCSSFTTSKGDTIYADNTVQLAGTDTKQDIWDFPFDRMETVYGYGEDEEGKLIDWNNGAMTISNKSGLSCSYNFNNWTYSGGDCEGEVSEPGLITDFNCDDQVNIQDFGILLSYWQQRENLNNYQHPQCSRLQNLDLVPDNVINGADIGILLSCWGTPTNPVCFEEVS